MKKTILTIGWVCFLLLGMVATALADTTDVTVTVEEVLCVDYTGEDLTFYIGADDFEEGSQGIMNQGDLNWCANVSPWAIMVVRTDWLKSPNPEDWGDHGTSDIHLQIKKGPDDNTDWVSIYTVDHDPPGPTVWLTSADNEEGNPIGTGTFTGVDWKVKQIGWDDADPYGWLIPGLYTCTVTFTIVST